MPHAVSDISISHRESPPAARCLQTYAAAGTMSWFVASCGSSGSSVVRSRSATHTRYCRASTVASSEFWQRQSVRSERQRGQPKVAIHLQQSWAGAPERRDPDPPAAPGRAVARSPRRGPPPRPPGRQCPAAPVRSAGTECRPALPRPARRRRPSPAGWCRPAAPAAAAPRHPMAASAPCRAAAAARSRSAPDTTASATVSRSECGTSRRHHHDPPGIVGHQMHTRPRRPPGRGGRSTSANSGIALDASSGPLSRLAWR